MKQQLYEGMYILNASLTDDARQKALAKITAGIESRGGQIHKMFDQGRRRLAYDIAKKREGHYILLYFTATTPSITEMWGEYHLNEDLLRYLTLRVETVPEKIEFKPLVRGDV